MKTVLLFEASPYISFLLEGMRWRGMKSGFGASFFLPYLLD